MENQVVELVVYKVKNEYIENFQSEVIPKFRELVKGFGGIVSMQTFQCIEQQGVYYDHVVWENHKFALSAAKKFEDFQQKGENLELISWFEEVKFMDHFKQVA